MIKLFLSVLTLAALACLAPVAAPTLVSGPAADLAQDSGLVSDLASPGTQESTLVSGPAGAPTQETPTNLVSDIADPEAQGTRCATVTAFEAVHLRTGPTAHSPAIDWLEAGDVVTVHLQEAGWTFATAGSLTGYVNSNYLEEIPCQTP